MNKTRTALCLGFLMIAACDPMDDVYKELGIDNPPYEKKEVPYTLAAGDYELLEDVDGAPEHIFDEHYFANDEEAAQYIPTILMDKFPQFSDGSSVNTTFNRVISVFDDFEIANPELNSAEYEVVAEDYDITGERFDNFDSEADLQTFLGIKFADSADATLKVLTYDYYSGTTNTVQRAFYKADGVWTTPTYLISPAEYALSGNNYNNYEQPDLEKLPGYFDYILKAKQLMLNPINGTTIHVVFKLYLGGDDGTGYDMIPMVYDGTDWKEATETNTEPIVMKFTKTSGAWNPDLTKTYTLVGSDYNWIMENSTAGSASDRANLSYGNFSTFVWTRDEIALALGELMNHLFPNEEVGQKYNINYATYSGSAGTADLTLEKTASGSWAVPETE